MFSADAVKEADARAPRGPVPDPLVGGRRDGRLARRQAGQGSGRRKGQALKVHGLDLLLSKKDHKFYAEPSDPARKAFTHEKVKELDDAITRAFKAGKFDQGLRDAVSLIRRDAEAAPDTTVAAAASPPVVAAHPVEPARPVEPTRPTAPTAPETTVQFGQAGSVLPMLLIGGGLLVLFLWVLSRAFRVVRRRPLSSPSTRPAPGRGPGYGPGPAGTGSATRLSPRTAGRLRPPPQPGYRPAPQPGYAPGPQPGYGPGPQPGYAYPPPAGGRRRRLLSGVLGGAAGAVAGNILYDKFGHPHEAPGVPPHIPARSVPRRIPPGRTRGARVALPPPLPVRPTTPTPAAAATGAPPSRPPNPMSTPRRRRLGAAPEPNVDASAGGDWGAPTGPGTGCRRRRRLEPPTPNPSPMPAAAAIGALSDPAPDDNQGGSW